MYETTCEVRKTDFPVQVPVTEPKKCVSEMLIDTNVCLKECIFMINGLLKMLGAGEDVHPMPDEPKDLISNADQNNGYAHEVRMGLNTLRETIFG